ncbi:MAG: transcriptional regulator, partial [Alcaligenaceae bacterium]
MNTFSNAFRAEVIRMARKELKPELQAMRKAIAAQRSEIAALKRDVKSLTSQTKSTQRKAGVTVPVEATVTATSARKAGKFKFNPQALIEKRKSLGITQKEMAHLLGASMATLFRWQGGVSTPRAAQSERIAVVLE